MKTIHFLYFSLVVVCALLIVSVYFGVARTGPDFLISSTSTPATYSPLVLCDEKLPTFLNPFRKVEYSYHLEGSTECSIVEETETMLTSELVPVKGNVKDHWGGFDEDGFVRSFVTNDFANYRLFILQYILILALAANVFTLKKTITSHNSG